MKTQRNGHNSKRTASRIWLLTTCLWIPGLLVAIAASVALAYCTGPLPNMDYWWVTRGFYPDSGFRLSLGALLGLSNEHVVMLPKLVYVINYCLDAGSNVGLSIWTAVCAALTLACLIKVLGRTRVGCLNAALLSLTVAVFMFNPLAAHNFFWGMSGTDWVTANLLVVLALLAFSGYVAEQKRGWMLLTVLALLIASITYSTGLMGWICVAGFAFVFPRTRRSSYALGVAFVVMMLIMTVAQLHALQPYPKVYDPVQVAGFAVVYLGGALTPTPEKAVAFGCLGLFLLAAAVLESWKTWAALSERQRVLRAFWFALAAYALLNALFAGVGRSSGGDLMTAVTSRYVTLPSLYWIALLGLAATMLRGWPLRFASMLGLVAVIYAVHAGIPRLKQFVHGAAVQKAAALGVYLGAKDDSAIRSSMITYWPYQIHDVRAGLKAAGHVPFNGMFAGCPQLGSHIRIVSGKRMYPGYVDRSMKLDSGATRMDGWVAWKTATKGKPADKPHACMALASDSGVVEGLAQMTVSRPDVRKALGKSYDNRAWTGYVVKHGNGKVHVYAMSQEGAWHLVK